MTIRNRLSAAMPFAQLLGFHPRADEGDDEDKSKRAKGEGDEPDKDDDTQGKKAKGKKAENDEDDKDDGDAKGAKGDSDEPDEGDAKGRKAKRADDDSDDSDADDDDDKAISKQAIVSQERARCAQIVAHGFRAGSPEQACVFAFDTSMSADAAISAINAAGVVGGKGGSFKDRMAAANVQNVGAGGGDDLSADVSLVAQQIIAAAARAQPQTR